MKRWVGILGLIAWTVFALGACARATGSGSIQPSPSQTDSSPISPPIVLPTNLSDAIGGIRVASVSEAAQYLPFTVLDPQSLGSPEGIYVTDPSTATETDRVVEFDYTTSDFGQVVVEETTPTIPVDQWAAFEQANVAQNGSALLHGSFAVATIRDGSSGLVITSEDGSQSEIRWLESDSLEVIVRGPTLSPDQCVQIANDV
jgi:hypothetical protein